MSPLWLIIWVPTGLLGAFLAWTDALLFTKAGRKELLRDERPAVIFWMHVFMIVLVAISLDCAGVRL